MKLVGTEFKDRVDYYNTSWWPAREHVVAALNKRSQVCFIITQLAGQLSYVINKEMYGRRRCRRRRPHLGDTNCN